MDLTNRRIFRNSMTASLPDSSLRRPRSALRLTQTGVVQKLGDLVSFIPSALAIAVRPVPLVPQCRAANAPVDRCLPKNVAELPILDYPLAVVAHQRVPGPGGSEQVAQRTRRITPRAPGAPLLAVGNETRLPAQHNSIVEPPARDQFGHVVVACVLPRVVRRIHVQQI